MAEKVQERDEGERERRKDLCKGIGLRSKTNEDEE